MAFHEVAEPVPLTGQSREHPVQRDERGAGSSSARQRGVARDSAADERAEDEAEEHVEWADAADGAAFAEADDREDDEVDEDAAGHGLVEAQRIVGEIAAEDKMRGAAEIGEVRHGGGSRKDFRL